MLKSERELIGYVYTGQAEYLSGQILGRLIKQPTEKKARLGRLEYKRT